jgi:hypothetical protein
MAMNKRTFFCLDAASGTLHEDVLKLRFFGVINLPEKHCCATLNISVQLTKSSSTKHTERIAAFPLQQQLSECTTMLRYTNTAYLVILTDVRTTKPYSDLYFTLRKPPNPKSFGKEAFISPSLQTMG